MTRIRKNWWIVYNVATDSAILKTRKGDAVELADEGGEGEIVIPVEVKVAPGVVCRAKDRRVT